MNQLSPLIIVVAGIISVITMAVSWKAMKAFPPFHNPLIALCTGGLTFLGLINLSRDWATGILLLYATTAIAILLILIFMPLLQNGKNRTGKLDALRAVVRMRSAKMERIRKAVKMTLGSQVADIRFAPSRFEAWM